MRRRCLGGDHMSWNSWDTARCIKSQDADCTNILVPLLDPLCFGGCSRAVPFVTGIELHGVDDEMVMEGCTRGTGRSFEEEYYELRFVLHGRGVMKYVGKDVEDEVIHPGDAILCKHGSVLFDVCTPGVGGDGEHERLMAWDMTTFVVYIPKKVLESRTLGDGEVFGDCTQFAQEVLWPGEPCARGISQVISPDVLDGLLCGPKMVETSLPVADVIQSDDEDGVDQQGGDFTALRKTLSDVSTFMLPNQTNRLALMFDPFANTPIPFVFGVEIFEPGHKTTPHVHTGAYEVFFILSGNGYGFCGTERFPVGPGDIVAFHPGSTHGIDNGLDQRMYCIEVMLPDEDFAEFVRQGEVDSLGDDDLCVLTRVGCS